MTMHWPWSKKEPATDAQTVYVPPRGVVAVMAPEPVAEDSKTILSTGIGAFDLYRGVPVQFSAPAKCPFCGTNRGYADGRCKACGAPGP